MKLKYWKTPTAALAAAALVAIAAPAASAATTECTDDLGDAAVAGDLYVPDGATCVLGGATVSGSVIVGEDGWLDATSVTIEGDVIGAETYGILLDGTSVGGDVVSYTDGSRAGFLYLLDLEVGGNVETGGVDVEISDSSVAGSVSTLGATYVDILRTQVSGDLSIADSDWGVSLAGTVVTGSVTISGSSRDVLVGATRDGGADRWGNTIGGDLTLVDNTANLQVAGATVLGTIVLDGNDPAANFGPGNSAGAVEGDYTGEAPAAGIGDGEQAVVVVVPEPDAGEFIWTIDSTSDLVDLGVAVENGDHFAAEGELNPVRVTDTRFDAPEWSISGQVSDFTAGEETVSGKHLGWTPYVVEDDGGAAAGAPVASGFDEGEGLSVSRTLGSASAGHERGSTVLGADLELKLPVTVESGTYNATLTLTALS